MKQHAIGTPRVTVEMLFDPTASSKRNNPHATRYWQVLFEELGGVSLEDQ